MFTTSISSFKRIILCSPMPSSSPSCNRHTDSRYTRIGPNIYAPFSSKITRRINHHVPCFPPPSLTWVCGTSFLLTLARIGACLLGFLYTTNLNTLPPSSRTALKLKPSLRVVVRTKTENEDEGNAHMPIRPSAMASRKRRSRRGCC